MDSLNNYYNDTSDIDLLLKVLDRMKDTDAYGNTPLHTAIKENQSTEFHLLLKKIDLNCPNHLGDTPLHCAVANDRYEFTKILLEHGANVNIRNNKERTPLYLALEKSNIHLAEVLFKNNAVLYDHDFQSLNTFNDAITSRNMELIKFLMKNGWNIVDNRYGHHYPICLAVQTKNLEIVKYLMENGLKSSGTINEDRLGLLDICIALDSVEMLKYLIDIGVKTKRNLLDHSLRNLRQRSWKYILSCHSKVDLNTYFNESELHLAVRAGDLDFVKVFVNKKSLAPKSLASRLAVYIAVENNDEEILKVLLKAGYSSESCFKDTSPLHLAATFEHARLVDLLLNFGADVNSQTEHRYSPLHFAAASGRAKIVKHLLARGANPTSDCDNHGSPLSFALRMFSCRVDRSPVTLELFKDLVLITELLIKLTQKNVCRLLTQASSIWVCREQTKTNGFILLSKETLGGACLGRTDDGCFGTEDSCFGTNSCLETNSRLETNSYFGTNSCLGTNSYLGTRNNDCFETTNSYFETRDSSCFGTTNSGCFETNNSCFGTTNSGCFETDNSCFGSTNSYFGTTDNSYFGATNNNTSDNNRSINNNTTNTSASNHSSINNSTTNSLITNNSSTNSFSINNTTYNSSIKNLTTNSSGTNNSTTYNSSINSLTTNSSITYNSSINSSTTYNSSINSLTTNSSTTNSSTTNRLTNNSTTNSSGTNNSSINSLTTNSSTTNRSTNNSATNSSTTNNNNTLTYSRRIVEFHPEMLSTIFNHLTDYEIQCYSQFLLQKAHTSDTPLQLLNFLTEYNDSKSRYSITINNNSCLDYNAKLLLLDYSKNVDDLLNLDETGPFVKSNRTILKQIIARLVLLTHSRHTGLLKFSTKHKLLDWRNECEVEKFTMRSKQIDVNYPLTFNDILMKPVGKIVGYTRNESFLQTLESSQGQFGIYHDFLKINIQKCIRRRNFLKKCTNLVFGMVKRNYQIQLSIAEIELIFQYLSVVDLQRLSAACT